MPFPQGGDFSKSVGGLFKVLQSDRRICKHDNGTTTCDQGHKIKFVGACFNQSLGTFNSTDPDFQPEFPICTVDYDSSGFSDGVLFSADVKEGSGSVIGTNQIYEGAHPLVQGPKGATKQGKVYIRDFADVFISHFMQHVPAVAFIDHILYGVPFVISSVRKMIQLNPGDLPYGEDIFSDLYVYDVASFFVVQKTLTFDRLEYFLPPIKIHGDLDYSHTLFSPPTTISGTGDICVGDLVAPNIVYHSPPASGTVLAVPNQLIDFSLNDAIAGVDITSVYVVASGTASGRIPLVQAGINQVPSDLALTGDPASYRFIYTRPSGWIKGEAVTVNISATDLPPQVDGDPFFCGDGTVNPFVGDIYFRVLDDSDLYATISGVPDVTPPAITYSSPANGTSNNNIFAPLQLHITDDFTGLDLATLQVNVDGLPIVVDGVAQSSEVSIDPISLGYSVVYEPLNAFAYGSTVTVTVEASDKVKPVGNFSSNSISFSFITDDTLLIENFLPAVGTSIIQSSLDIQVDLRDDSYGVDEAQSYFIINGTIVSGTQIPLASGIRMTYHPPNEYNYGEPIRVKVHAVNGNVSAPVVTEQLYVLYYGLRLLYDNPQPYEHNQNVNVFVKARNLQQFYKDLTTGYYFSTYTQPSSSLGATIYAFNPISDLAATVQAIVPEHRYGEMVDVEFYIEDENGYAFGPYRFSYTIENRPG